MLNKKNTCQETLSKGVSIEVHINADRKKVVVKNLHYTFQWKLHTVSIWLKTKNGMVSNDVFLTTYRSTATVSKWIRQIDEYYNFWQLPNKITRQSIKRTWTRLKWSIFNAANKKEKTREFQLCFNKTSTRKQFLTDKVIYTYL